jgi:hypothetical protein
MRRESVPTWTAPIEFLLYHSALDEIEQRER